MHAKSRVFSFAFKFLEYIQTVHMHVVTGVEYFNVPVGVVKMCDTDSYRQIKEVGRYT